MLKRTHSPSTLVIALIVLALLLLVLIVALGNGALIHWVDGSGVFIRAAYCLPFSDCSPPRLEISRMWAWQYGRGPD